MSTVNPVYSITLDGKEFHWSRNPRGFYPAKPENGQQAEAEGKPMEVKG